MAAIKSFFRYLEYREPHCIEQARQIHGIPLKKCDEGLVAHLNREEIQSLLDAPDASTAFSLRDGAMLHVAYACGLRVAELVSLRLDQLDSRTPPSIRVIGKGRRERVLPLWKETTAALNAWLNVRQAHGAQEMFPNAGGRAVTRAGFEYILDKHVSTANKKQPSITKKRVTPHVLRHAHPTGHGRHPEGFRYGWATRVFRARRYTSRADSTEKLDALAMGIPPTLKRGKFKAPDKLRVNTASRRQVRAPPQATSTSGASTSLSLSFNRSNRTATPRITPCN